MIGRILAAAAICLAAAACATPQTDFLRRNPGLAPSSGAVADPVFFAQRTNECGPAALAMVLARSGVRVTPDELVPTVYNAGRDGSLPTAVLAGVRRHGRIAYPINDLTALFRAVGRGRPVLVLQNLSLQWLPQWHYAVVVGFDFGKGTVTLHSGTTKFLEMPVETFEHTWARSGYWALVALRPGEFPDGVDEMTYVKAVAGIERAGPADAAAQAYAAALERWPDNLIAALGLGNTRYRLGDRAGAARAFRTASERHPKSGAALNNLAHVLAELGRLDEAERAARTAVGLGGAEAATYRETLRSILATRASPASAVRR